MAVDKPELTPAIAYTIGTGKLYCKFEEFHGYAERLMDRPIWTHEFANPKMSIDLKEALEQKFLEEVDD